MNLNILKFATAGLLLTLSFPHDLTGTWISKGPDHSQVTLTFKKNGDFKVMVNGDVENEGTYTFRSDTFSMYDRNCGMNYAGRYKITFYNQDSASFSLISDSCTSRASEVDGGIIKRVKISQ